MSKVSVIVPVYGVEKFIERCVRSLFEQTLDEMEFIFVDDCTPDNSIKILNNILNQYPHRVCQTQIIHHEINKGLPQARLTGLKKATGQYIAHCDSDDWVDIHMYREMYDKAVKYNSDLVICDLCRTDLESFYRVDCGCHTKTKLNFIRNCLYQKDHWSLCNKIFKKEVYNNPIIYPTAALGEDMVLSLQLINHCENIEYINKPFYNYYVNLSSITKKRTSVNCVNNFYTLKENIELLANYLNNECELDKIIKDDAITYLRMINSFCLLGVKHLPQYKQMWNENRVNMSISFFLNTRISWYNKILYCLSFLPFYPLKGRRVKK